MLKVIKRNGRKVNFNKSKIEQAILKAYKVLYDEQDDDESGKQLAKRISNEIEKLVVDEISVEDIQDLVEKKLMSSSYKDVAKIYIKYRYLKSMARTQYDELWEAVDERLKAKKVKNQNANVDEYSFGGRRGSASDYIDKKFALDYIVSEKSRANHLNNRVYIHDLDNYAVGMHNCLSIPFDDLLANGFTTRQTDVRPAGSVCTAFQLFAVIFQLQSLQQFGGVSSTHIDWTLVPYVRKSFYKHYVKGLMYICNKEFEQTKCDITDISITDRKFYNNSKAYDYAMKMTEDEIYQGAEGLYHNLNTLQSRSGNQLPFTSINYGTCTLTEGRMITKALLDNSIIGLGKLHKTSIFPCGIFQWWDKVNGYPGTPNYDLYQLALKSTATRLYPNYCNCNWSVDTAFNKMDVDIKNKVLNELSDEEMAKLVTWCKSHKEQADEFGFVIKNE